MINMFRLIESISPSLTAKMAFRYISNPRIKKFRSFEKPILEKAAKKHLRFKDFDIAVYEWGKGQKVALLVHGWEGRASNFGYIIPLLLEHGYRVVSFDAPSHGNSSKKKTNFFDISELIEVFLKKEKYDLIITHSIGSVMSLMAMNKLTYHGNTLIVCTTPNKFEDYVEHAINHFGLTVRTKKAFLELVRKETIYEPLDLQASLFVKNIVFNKAVFIHDTDDSVINIKDSYNVCRAMHNANFVEVNNTGHFKMLWSDTVRGCIEKYL